MNQESESVVIVYHFFAHYREPIIRELINNSNYHYIFAGDDHDPSNSGIKAYQFNDGTRFIHTHSIFIREHYLLQSGLIELAFRKNVKTIIYLGVAQFISTWISAALARLNGKRVLFWSHGWLRRESGVKDWIRSKFYRIGHGLLLYGNRAKAIGVEKDFKPENLYVVYNSLDYKLQKKLREQRSLESIAQVRQELFEEHHRPMVICTARLIQPRRLDLLLEALCHLKAQGHEVNLLLVGDGPEHSNLQQMAISNNLSVRFFGECYEEKVLAGLIMAANVTVAPNQLGLTAIHSLVYGIPVVSNDNPDECCPEREAIIPGINGALFKHGDSMDLARVISEWTQSEFLSEHFRQQCYDIIDRYYNPEYQSVIFDQAVSGKPATDTLWMNWINS